MKKLNHGRHIARIARIAMAASLVALAGAAQAQSRIGDGTGLPGSLPVQGAILDLNSSTRGLLMSRVAITDRNTWTLVGGTPIEGMVVYNSAATAGVNGLQEGLAVWRNGQWISVDETPYMHVNSTLTGNSTLSNSGATGANAIAIGPNAVASAADGVAIGARAGALGAQGVALGAGSSVTQAGGVALGAASVADTAAGVAGYVPPTATDAQRIAIGATTGTLAAVSVGNAATGQYRQITGVAAGAADSDAVNVSQLRAVQGTVAGIDQSTVHYDTNADGTVNYNSVTMGGSNATGPVAVRNVAPGVAGTDAVNVNQLTAGVASSARYTDARVNQLQANLGNVAKEASAGTAGAMAMANLPQAYLPGKSMVAVGIASYDGQGALAVGVSRLSENAQWVVKFSGTANSRGKVGVAAGAGFHW